MRNDWTTIMLVRRGDELSWQYGKALKISPQLTAYLTEGIECEVLEVWYFRNLKHLNAEMNAVSARISWWETQFEFEAEDLNHG